MRVTNSMLVGNMSYNLNQSLNRMQMLQYQTSTGKKFRIPSDDPIGASKSLKFRTDISKVEQYRRNVKDAKSWMVETEGALSEVNKILHRANELTNQAANETNSPEDLEKIKAEISELRESLIKLGNTTYGGRSIFTGYATDKKLLNEDGTYAVDLSEIGSKDEEVFEYNTGVSESVKVNTLGNKVFGKVESEDNIGDPDYDSEIKEGDRPYLIGLFEELEKALGKADNERLQQGLEDIANARGNILSITAEIGARSNRLDITKDKLEDQALNLEDLLSGVEDVSIPEAYMSYMLEKNVYNASLSVGSQIIQPSLADFIR